MSGMNMREMAVSLGLSLTADQFRAGAYLERLGQKFCANFGYENAVDKARTHWLERRRKQQQKRRARL